MINVRVVSRKSEAVDIDSFELVSVDGKELPPFSAGSHIDVHTKAGLTRQYSLCNAPDERHQYRIGVLKDPSSRGGSQSMHELDVGDTLFISSPRNLFPLAHESRYTMLFAGGIGITPILCMAQRLAKTSAAFELHYCARASDRAAFVDELRQSSFSDRVFFHFDDGEQEQKLNADKVLAVPPPGTDLYVCGPTGFMDFILGTAEGKGWPPGSLHKEYFSAPQVIGDTDAFEVMLASTGETYVIAADKSVVEVLAENGVEIPVSCEQGICGTCVTKVLEGTPDHRDMFMTQEEHLRNDQFTPCCSRAKSARLVLDI
jgi:vanillate O-demethylase ferredoxin subunit